ncbi:MAG: methionine--tRNA ligase, partial [Anaerolineae bacterium]|nr:methionine--tRNA ligase [Anaerolineae bacterium]
QYLEATSPWVTWKNDLQATARSLHTALQAINGLKVLFAPVLPFTSQQLHGLLGADGQLFGRQMVTAFAESSREHIALTYDGSSAVGRWTRSEVPIGRKLPKPTPLFKKLDESLVSEELARLGTPS